METAQKIDTLLNECVKLVADNRRMGQQLSGIPSGFTEIDRASSGFQKGTLTIIAARPGMGATSFVLSVARNAAVDFKMKVVVFSLAMPAVQIGYRLIAAETGTTQREWVDGQISEEEWQALPEKIAALGRAHIFVDDTADLNFMGLRVRCRKLKEEHGIEMIVIEQIQLMADNEKADKNGCRQAHICKLAESLKDMAVELDIAIIAVLPLRHQLGQREDTQRPVLLDLREFGPIDRVAHQVLFIYRPEYYNIVEDETGVSTAGQAEIIIAKNGNRTTASVNLRFEERSGRFRNWKDGE